MDKNQEAEKIPLAEKFSINFKTIGLLSFLS